MSESHLKKNMDYVLFVNRELSQVHIFVSADRIPHEANLPAHFKHQENTVTIPVDDLRTIIMQQPELNWVIENQATEQNYLWLLFFMKDKNIKHVIKLDVQIEK